jgi:hypothetical protein
MRKGLKRFERFEMFDSLKRVLLLDGILRGLPTAKEQ